MPRKKREEMSVVLEPIDSVAAIKKFVGEGKTAVLNFASYKNPGGGFMNGMMSQEEALCHESFLYNVLEVLYPQYYHWNNQHLNRGLYLNRALYTPDVRFGEIFCDVITCAAPNWGPARRYGTATPEENSEILESRIRFVLEIARHMRVDTLILGAYGCGVFKQDATEVARIFKELLKEEYHNFNKVVFAIPVGRDGNLQKFVDVFTEE